MPRDTLDKTAITIFSAENNERHRVHVISIYPAPLSTIPLLGRVLFDYRKSNPSKRVDRFSKIIIRNPRNENATSIVSKIGIAFVAFENWRGGGGRGEGHLNLQIHKYLDSRASRKRFTVSFVEPAKPVPRVPVCSRTRRSIETRCRFTETASTSVFSRIFF